MTIPDVSQESVEALAQDLELDARGWALSDIRKAIAMLRSLSSANAALRKERDDATFEMQERATTLAGHLDAMADLVAEIAALQERAEKAEQDTVPRSRYDACNRDWLIEKDRADGISARAATYIQTLEAERDALRVRLAEIEKDAARYQFMRNQAHSLERNHAVSVSCYHIVGEVRELKHGVELDAAIDAALASQGGEKAPVMQEQTEEDRRFGQPHYGHDREENP